MKTVYLGLGSNSGDRQKHFTNAVVSINRLPDTTLEQTSSVYETIPKDMESENPFLNCVVQIETSVPSLDLLDALKDIETQLGRTESVPGAYTDRPIDIDILLYGDECCKLDRLTVPHCRLHERPFVLIPLNEIAPQMVHPVRLQTSAQMLKKLTWNNSDIKRFEV